jgi:hypothetical protein
VKVFSQAGESGWDSEYNRLSDKCAAHAPFGAKWRRFFVAMDTKTYPPILLNVVIREK